MNERIAEQKKITTKQSSKLY